jgi:hypothetical protein
MVRKTERASKAEVAAKQRAYLLDTFKELHVTPSGAASALGLAASTFTRFLKLPDTSEKTLAASTMDKVEHLRQINSDSGFPTQAQAQWQTVREEATHLELAEHQDIARLVAAIMDGHNGIDAWTLNSRSLELEGFMPGDVVLVDMNAQPKPGDAVCADIRDRDNNTSTVMRLFQEAGPVNVLLARTMDPTTQGAIVIDKGTVTIRGVLLPHRLRSKLAA